MLQANDMYLHDAPISASGGNAQPDNSCLYAERLAEQPAEVRAGAENCHNGWSLREECRS